MSENAEQFGKTAKSLARNPLGIIALFIALVYGFASLVTTFGGLLTVQERIPLIYFLVVFPVLVLGVFAWLVSNHSGKLFAPSDFKNEDNYVKMQMQVVASLTAASAKSSNITSEGQLDRIVESVQAAGPATKSKSDGWRHQILWVDDRPENNTYERKAFESMGLRFTLALSTAEALEWLSKSKFAAIISDMGRKEGPREGYVLLDQIRQQGNRTPLFFYAASNAPEHKQETEFHDGQGCTNNAQELFEMVTKALIGQEAA
jgi:CheY-like chemotaxis protein